MALTTPVLLLVYNRTQYLPQIIDVLSQIKPTQLFIVADGPKSTTADVKNCRAVRSYLDSHIDWKCQVKKLYRRNNRGCRLGVSEGITWFFAHVQEGIILEDDCVPDLSFFPYCTNLLDRYRDNPNILTISGNNFHRDKMSTPNSYYFSHYPNIWGWATWKRAWDLYDVDMGDWRGSSSLVHLKQIIPNKLIAQYYAQTFDDVQSERIDTWDYQLTYLHLKLNRLSIIPAVNLVHNLGFDAFATHTKTRNRLSHVNAESISFPLLHPTQIVADSRAEYLTNLPILQNPLGIFVVSFSTL